MNSSGNFTIGTAPAVGFDTVAFSGNSTTETLTLTPNATISGNAYWTGIASGNLGRRQQMGRWIIFNVQQLVRQRHGNR